LPPSWSAASGKDGNPVSGGERRELAVEINQNAPALAEGELYIEADPATVFSVISAIEDWPSWQPDVKSAKLDGPIQPGTIFRWKAGRNSLTSRLEIVDPPREIAWTGTTMGIKAIHVFRFDSRHAGTVARSEESWEGFIPRMLKGYSSKTLDTGIRTVLSHLKTEAERRASTAEKPESA
jgi:uncharacterized protein YndB with AHSA1/START domain